MARNHYLALTAGITAAMLLTAGPLAAHDSDEPLVKGAKQSEDMVFADKNRDGKVTRKEAKVDKALERVFDSYDTNRDDVLDQAEFARLESGRHVAGDNPTIVPAPMEPIEYPRNQDDRLRPRHTVHPTPP